MAGGDQRFFVPQNDGEGGDPQLGTDAIWLATALFLLGTFAANPKRAFTRPARLPLI
jgi:hypothetical protein